MQVPFRKRFLKLKSSDNSNVDIRVVLPFHGGIQAFVPPLTKIAKIKIQTQKGFAQGQIFQFCFQGITYYLIKRSGNPSGYKDIYNPTQIEDARKYIFFSLACLELLKSDRLGARYHPCE